MGMSKALAEKILQARSRMISKNKTILCITRYGNVMGSRASIIPRFYSLAKEKKTLPITDKKMTRFLMSLDDSVNLVIHALVKGKQGEIFVQKSPACKITDLAKAIAPHIKHKIIGVRPGEKINELMCPNEFYSHTLEFKDHFIIFPQPKIFDNSKSFIFNKLGEKGKKVSSEFEYRSDTNKQFLKINEIKKLLNSN